MRELHERLDVRRRERWILSGYVVLVYGGLATAAAVFWWVTWNCSA